MVNLEFSLIRFECVTPGFRTWHFIPRDGCHLARSGFRDVWGLRFMKLTEAGRDLVASTWWFYRALEEIWEGNENLKSALSVQIAWIAISAYLGHLIDSIDRPLDLDLRLSPCSSIWHASCKTCQGRYGKFCWASLQYRFAPVTWAKDGGKAGMVWAVPVDSPQLVLMCEPGHITMGFYSSWWPAMQLIETTFHWSSGVQCCECYAFCTGHADMQMPSSTCPGAWWQKRNAEILTQEFKFPAAVDDFVSAYRSLIDERFASSMGYSASVSPGLGGESQLTKQVQDDGICDTRNVQTVRLPQTSWNLLNIPIHLFPLACFVILWHPSAILHPWTEAPKASVSRVVRRDPWWLAMVSCDLRGGFQRLWCIPWWTPTCPASLGCRQHGHGHQWQKHVCTTLLKNKCEAAKLKCLACMFHLLIHVDSRIVDSWWLDGVHSRSRTSSSAHCLHVPAAFYESLGTGCWVIPMDKFDAWPQPP